MALSQINPVSRGTKKKDALERIMEGLAILKAGTGIYSDIQTGRAKSAEIDTQKRHERGEFTAEERQKLGQTQMPVVSKEVQGEAGPIVQAVSRFKNLPTKEAEGKIWITDKGQLESAEKREDALHKEWFNREDTQSMRQMKGFYASLLAGAGKRTAVGNTIMATSILKMINPSIRPDISEEGISKLGKNEGIAEEAIKAVRKALKGGGDYDETDMARMLQAGRSVYANRLALYRDTISGYEKMAERQGLLPEMIVTERFDMPSQAEIKKAASEIEKTMGGSGSELSALLAEKKRREALKGKK